MSKMKNPSTIEQGRDANSALAGLAEREAALAAEHGDELARLSAERDRINAALRPYNEALQAREALLARRSRVTDALQRQQRHADEYEAHIQLNFALDLIDDRFLARAKERFPIGCRAIEAKELLGVELARVDAEIAAASKRIDEHRQQHGIGS